MFQLEHPSRRQQQPVVEPGPPFAPNIYSHSRTRTTSSNIFPLPLVHTSTPSPSPLAGQQHPPAMQYSNRRTPSVNTFSTVSTMPPPAAYRTSPTNDIRRSISSRSDGRSPHQPVSYVAALRRQKGTVWSDRAQAEDPVLLAQQRAAKMRAANEILGGPRTNSSLGLLGPANTRTNTGLSATGKVAAKIRHHGKPGVVGYSPGEKHIGVAGVPMRLSATEVEGGDSDDDDGAGLSKLHHRRTGSSGRSSTTSGRRVLAYRASGSLPTPRRYSPGDTPERSGSLVEQQRAEGDIVGGPSDAASGKAPSMASASSGERADNVGDLASAPRLAANSLQHATITRERSIKTVDDLKRRGSVDERTMTLSTGRLYIANPD